MLRLTCLLLLALAAASIASGCKSSGETKKPESYVALAKERYGDNAEFIDNATDEYVLVVSKTEPSQTAPQPTASFFVYGKEEGAVTYEDEIVGSVTWLDDYYLELVIIPEIVKADSEPGGVVYRVDVRSGSRVESTSPARRR